MRSGPISFTEELRAEPSGMLRVPAPPASTMRYCSLILAALPGMFRRLRRDHPWANEPHHDFPIKTLLAQRPAAP
jgi:hypothetical protein